jgi:hypothetical protein
MPVSPYKSANQILLTKASYGVVVEVNEDYQSPTSKFSMYWV